MNTYFPCIEIGSLPKMPGRAALLKGQEPTPQDKEQVTAALAQVNHHHPELVQLAESFFAAKGKKAVIEANSKFYIRLLEELGLANIFDGEAQRPEMYEGVVQDVHGMKRLDKEVSFVNKQGFPNTFVPFTYEGALSIDRPLHVDETRFILGNTNMPLKVPVTGAYTLGTWSDLGKKPGELRKEGLPLSEARRRTMEELVLQFADNVINPTLKALANTGVARIQIDEPNASAFYDGEELLYEATRRSVAGVTGAELGMHICFSNDYQRIAGIVNIPELHYLTLEIANRDTPDHRTYTEVIRAFEDAGYKWKYCVGVLDIHTDKMESPALVAQRLCHVAEIVGPGRVEAAPDCGLRTRKLPIAVEKLRILVEGAKIANEFYQNS